MSGYPTNQSFRKPMVNDYLVRSATLWGRFFLCMIVRLIGCANPTIFFDDEQSDAARALLEALKVGRGIKGAIYDLSYRMTTRQNDKDRSRSPFYRFLVTIHLQSARDSNTFTGRTRIIPHFMPYRLTRLVMYLVGPIRMLEQEFLEMIPDSPPEPDDFIFVRRGIPLSRIYFTQILRNITAQYISIEIGSLDYIPVIKSMLAHMVNIQIDLDYDDAGPIDAAYQNSSPSLWKAMEPVISSYAQFAASHNAINALNSTFHCQTRHRLLYNIAMMETNLMPLLHSISSYYTFQFD
ncbi:hypothetical protein BDR07DRAFT_1378933 [Suillus spraguei]|nr:hypothetical protein BDR07DRAFT_1378907 [Suillus spraguei]KAG2359133.1 hypothetical protein BDR07DRAFT_1378933 [Suillus spraguei]